MRERPLHPLPSLPPSLQKCQFHCVFFVGIRGSELTKMMQKGPLHRPEKCHFRFLAFVFFFFGGEKGSSPALVFFFSCSFPWTAPLWNAPPRTTPPLDPPPKRQGSHVVGQRTPEMPVGCPSASKKAQKKKTKFTRRPFETENMEFKGRKRCRPRNSVCNDNPPQSRTGDCIALTTDDMTGWFVKKPFHLI